MGDPPILVSATKCRQLQNPRKMSELRSVPYHQSRYSAFQVYLEQRRIRQNSAAIVAWVLGSEIFCALGQKYPYKSGHSRKKSLLKHHQGSPGVGLESLSAWEQSYEIENYQ